MLPHLLSSRNPDALFNTAINQWLNPSETLAPSPSTLTPFSHPDLHFLPSDPTATSIGIEDIRQLNQLLQLKPIQSSTKLALIHLADRLTITAQNALLKTLEEPPPHALIILTSTKPHSLLPTILSRVIHTKITTDNEQLTTDHQQLISLLATSPASRLTKTQAIAPTRDSARQFIINSLHYFHQLLITNDQTQMTNDQLLMTLKLLNKSLSFLDANTHPQLTIDHLLLNLPKLPL